jgi:hypothetical protein
LKRLVLQEFLRKIKTESQLQYVILHSPKNKKLYYDLGKKLCELYFQMQEDFLEQCFDEIMMLIINLKLYGKQFMQSLAIVFRKVLLKQKEK